MKDINNEDEIVGTLVGLTQRKLFRSAWSFLQNNVSIQETRVKDAGIIIEDLSNEYGDIGDLKDDCRLKKKLEIDVNQVLKFLL